MSILTEHVLQFGSVETSSLKTTTDTNENIEVIYNVSGIDGIEENSIAERDEAPVYGSLGVLARPLDDDGTSNAEVVCARTSDGLVPIATKDTRINMPGNAPNKGTIAFVGYGGGFYSLNPVGGEIGEGTIHTLYCPYDFDGDGVAQKAHSINLDPTSGNESISIVHADGMAITMANGGGNNEVVIKNSDGSASIVVDDNGVTISGQINLSGSVVIGNPATAVPLLAGVASPPSSVLFVSP